MAHFLTGTLPLVITSDVSPPGNHTVRIVANNVAEDTVSFNISDTAEPTGIYHNNLHILKLLFFLYFTTTLVTIVIPVLY